MPNLFRIYYTIPDEDLYTNMYMPAVYIVLVCLNCCDRECVRFTWSAQIQSVLCDALGCLPFMQIYESHNPQSKKKTKKTHLRSIDEVIDVTYICTIYTRMYYMYTYLCFPIRLSRGLLLCCVLIVLLEQSIKKQIFSHKHEHHDHRITYNIDRWCESFAY